MPKRAVHNITSKGQRYKLFLVVINEFL